MCKRSMVILLMVFAAGLFTFRSAEAVSSDVSNSVEKVSVDVLVKAYDSNRFKAQKTYTGKTLEVSGQIYSITSDEKHPVIVLHASGYSVWIHCYVASDDPLLLDIEKDSSVTIRGYVSEVNTEHTFFAYTLTDGKIISAH